MIWERHAVRPAAKRLHDAAGHIVHRYREEMLAQEPDFTSRMLERMESSLSDFEAEGLTWRARVIKDRGPRSQESRIGADFVGVMFAGLIFFTGALFQALRGITGSSRFAWMSPTASLEQLGDVIFRLQPRYQISPALAGLAVVVLIAGSIWILMRRVRGVEIVT